MAKFSRMLPSQYCDREAFVGCPRKEKSIHLLLLLTHLVAAIVVLEPIHRRHWESPAPQNESDTHKCCSTSSINVALRDYEQLLWTTPNGTNQSTVVSMNVQLPKDRKIVDMARFSYYLAAANCSTNMSINFKSNMGFGAAKRAWDWVNNNSSRSFIIIADPKVCSSSDQQDPWIITRARYDQAALTIHLDAVNSTWDQVAQSYTIEFGNTVTPQRKRLVEERTLTYPLTVDFPASLIDEEFRISSGASAAASLDVKCVNCGIRGALLFGGRLEWNFWDGLTKFELFAVPQDVRVEMNIEMDFKGAVDFTVAEMVELATKEWSLFPIPIPGGFKIPGVITLGPSAELRAGYKLGSISGEGKITAGFAVQLPSNSLAKVDFISKSLVDVHGWLPEFVVQPLGIDAEINVKGMIYTELVFSAGLVVSGGSKGVNLSKDKKGLSLDIALQLPEVTIDATGGSDPAGFCPNDPRPYGVNLDVWLGAAVSVTGWEKTIDGPHTLFNEDLLKNDKVYHIPPHCYSFGSAGGCDLTLEPEDQEWWDMEVESGIESTSNKMARIKRVPSLLLPRAKAFVVPCGSNPASFKILSYPKPVLIRSRKEAGTDVPIMVPGITCRDTEAEDCPLSKWAVEESSNPDVMWVENNGNTGRLQHGWSTEHVYEGNWIKRFWIYLSDELELPCATVRTVFDIGAVSGYGMDMLSSIGNMQTYRTMMTLLPIKDNQWKYRMFEGHEFDGKFRGYSASKLSCVIGRLVNACKYMDMSETKSRLYNTISALNTVLDKIDANPAITTQVNGHTKFTGFRQAHETWFNTMYSDGISHARNKLQEYAREALKKSDINDLAPDVYDAINGILSGSQWATYCPSSFDYPSTSTPVEVECGDKQSDVHNCGTCGHECSSGQVCASGACSTVSPAVSFPPDVTPATTAKSGWLMSFQDQQYWWHDWNLPESFYMVYDGKRTVNTKCIQVGEIPDTRVTVIPANSELVFETKKEPNPDTCCLALFDGTECVLDPVGVHSRTYCDGADSLPIPFSASAWMVYGCTGLWTGTYVSMFG